MSRVIYSTSTSSSALNYKRLKIIITNLQNYETAAVITVAFFWYITPFKNAAKDSLPCPDNTNKFIFPSNHVPIKQIVWKISKKFNERFFEKWIVKISCFWGVLCEIGQMGYRTQSVPALGEQYLSNHTR